MAAQPVAGADQAITLNPQLAEAYFLRGYVYAEVGKRDFAISDLENALELGLSPELKQGAEALLKELGQ